MHVATCGSHKGRETIGLGASAMRHHNWCTLKRMAEAGGWLHGGLVSLSTVPTPVLKWCLKGPGLLWKESMNEACKPVWVGRSNLADLRAAVESAVSTTPSVPFDTLREENQSLRARVVQADSFLADL